MGLGEKSHFRAESSAIEMGASIAFLGWIVGM
jgi:hypothetical protein